MMIALFNFRNTPSNAPVTQGLCRISRNPQWISLATMFLGSCIAIGSWLAIFLLLIAVVFYHFRILGEERACLNRFGEPYQNYLKRVPRYFLFF
jgi:protein-S-isoprenylcysteine O-methyltransferase Ste14